ncbi:copper transporter 6-like [Dioscorea cayenensis subsp. rotundata]|uniref:Copper transport protein n=1 Tax=Dioscorea cayennensis subsp. rotundata TaxID=55577 RepID=A0AB40CKY8_DIOCR|nr:copper transporter 6-like [Dioscorea cayenensis subsp. rotundata]
MEMENANMTGGDEQMPMNTNMSMSTSMHDGGGMSLMHMTFYWGKNSAILFSGWPGTSTGMYVLALVLVFVLAVLVEWLGHCRVAANGLVRTAVHTVRVALAYVVMLALMSFNVGVFIVAVVGHCVGFLIFGSSSLFWPAAPDQPAVSADDCAKAPLPPLAC